MEIKNENYVAIQGWMVNELHLAGNELIIYALIYGFSQDGESWFSGSSSYVGAWCGISRQSASANLKKLLDEKLVEKESVFGIGDRYRVSRNLTPTCQETLQGVSRNLTPTCQETLHNTILNTIGYNINNNKLKEKKEKALRKPTQEEVVQYVLEKKLVINPYDFFNYYEKLDWKDNQGNKVKSWKGKAVTWDTRELKRNPQSKPYVLHSETSSPRKSVTCPRCGSEVIAGLCTKCRIPVDHEGKELT